MKIHYLKNSFNDFKYSFEKQGECYIAVISTNFNDDVIQLPIVKIDTIREDEQYIMFYSDLNLVYKHNIFSSNKIIAHQNKHKVEKELSRVVSCISSKKIANFEKNLQDKIKGFNTMVNKFKNQAIVDNDLSKKTMYVIDTDFKSNRLFVIQPKKVASIETDQYSKNPSVMCGFTDGTSYSYDSNLKPSVIIKLFSSAEECKNSFIKEIEKYFENRIALLKKDLQDKKDEIQAIENKYKINKIINGSTIESIMGSNKTKNFEIENIKINKIGRFEFKGKLISISVHEDIAEIELLENEIRHVYTSIKDEIYFKTMHKLSDLKLVDHLTYKLYHDSYFYKVFDVIDDKIKAKFPLDYEVEIKDGKVYLDKYPFEFEGFKFK